MNNRDALIPYLIEIMLTQSTDTWLEQLNQQGIPCGPIASIDQVFDNPQVQHRGMLLELDHPTAGKVPSVANPIRLSESAVIYDKAPPLLGQHTEQVLSDLLALDKKRIGELKTAGTIG